MGDFLENNLHALQKNQPEVFRQLVNKPIDPSYHVAIIPDGSRVIYRDEAGKKTILTHPNNAIGQAKAFVLRNGDAFTNDKPFFFAGTLAGYEISAMIEKDAEEDWQTPRAIYVYSDNTDMFRSTLAIHDWSELINDGRLYFFIGDSASDQLLRFFKQNPAKPQPEQLLALSNQQTVQIALKVMQQAKKQAAETTVLNKKILDEYYNGMSASELAAAYLDPSLLRVMLISNKRSYFIQYSIRDIRMAFEAAGATVEVLEEKSPVDKMSGTWLLSALEKFRPHGLIFIDHLRSEYGSIYPERMPFICWLQDYMPGVHSSPNPKGITDRDLVVGTTDHVDQSVFSPSRLFRLPCLTNQHVFAKPITGHKDEFDSEFSFVSNISDSTEILCAQLVERYAPFGHKAQKSIRDIYNKIMDLYATGSMFEDYSSFYSTAFPIAKDADPVLASDPDFFFQLYNTLVGSAVRHQVLDWISRDDHDLSCWGRRWEKHPFLSKHAMGLIENGDDLVDLYRSTTFNLHVNQFALEHPRILDGIMAGGFFLVKKAASIGLLEIDECLFTDRNQLRERIEHFRSNPEDRRKIVEKNQQIIRKWATYDVGIRNFSTFFALDFIDEWLCVEVTDELLCSNADAITKSANSLAQRFSKDCGSFGLYASVATFTILLGLPENSMENLDFLDRYQTKWGSSKWPFSFSDEGRKKLSEALQFSSKSSSHPLCYEAKVLIDSWMEDESPGATAYRYCRQLKPGSHNDSMPDHFKESALFHPMYRNREDKISRHNQKAMIAGSGMNIAKGEAFALSAILFQKGAIAGAWAMVRPVVEKSNVAGRILLFASKIAMTLGKLKLSRELLDRYETWAEKLKIQDKNSTSYIDTLRALNLLSEGRKQDLTLALQKELGILDVVKELSQNPSPTHPVFGSGNLILNQAYQFPDLDNEVLRIDRIRPLGKGLLCRSKDGDAPLWYFDPVSANWRAVGAKFSFAGPYPTFDTANGHLFIVDSNNGMILVFDSALQLVEKFAAPFSGYVEDLAIGHDNAISLVDPYDGKLYFSKDRNDWKAIEIGNKQVIEKDMEPRPPLRFLSPEFELGAPWKLVRCGNDFLLGTKDSIWVFDENGTLKTEKKIPFYNAEFFSEKDRLFTACQSPIQIGQLDCETFNQNWSCTAPESDTLFFHCSAIASIDGELWVADDFLQKLYRFKLA